MEVLLSIFVLSIGLLGVVALIPVAGHQTEEGARNDRLAAAGRRSFREFMVREMHKSVNWRQPIWRPAGTDRAKPVPYLKMPTLGGNDTPVSIAFCIDPVGLELGGEAADIFPVRNTANPQMGFMNRISLGQLNGQLETPLRRMRRPQIDEIFYFQDDLEFQLSDNAAGPTQIFLPDQTNPLKRYPKEQFSWMAMLVPSATTDFNTYTLYTIVFQGRNAFEPERAAWVVMLSSGLGGGDFELKGSVELSSGDWVMLCRAPLATSFGPPGGGGLLGARKGEGSFAWYRVVAADQKYVTLNGPDWAPNIPPPYGADYLVVAPHVVGVYAKTVRLQH
jgi:hypothetical protein